MQQKEISRWLKAITIVLALMGAVFFLYIMPVLAMSWRDADESLAYLFMPGLLYGWCIAVICYAILYQFWKVCVQIGKDNSFSKENAKCFRNISHFALLLAVVWFAGIDFSGNLSGQAARNQYFYDHRSFAFGHDICFGSGIITSDPEGLRIKTGK